MFPESSTAKLVASPSPAPPCAADFDPLEGVPLVATPLPEAFSAGDAADHSTVADNASESANDPGFGDDNEGGSEHPSGIVTPPIETYRKLRLYTPSDLDKFCSESAKKAFVVDNLIARGSLGLVAGDSGLGKSPLFYQLGICVAAGIHWLDFPTKKGTVVYVDLENGELESKCIRDNLLRHLGLASCPDGFLTVYSSSLDLKCLVARVNPDLIVIDTLRAYDPTFEADNTRAGLALQGFRAIAHETGAAILLIHHTRKPSDQKPPPALEDTPAIEWLNSACGARALVNQTDFRLGLDARVGFGRAVLAASHPEITDEISLVFRGHVRVHGEVGPLYVARVFDDGQPIGYRRASGVELLCNADQQTAFAKLPAQFSFKLAKEIYGRRDQATCDFLEKCCRLGIAQKKNKGLYVKVKLITGSPTGVTGV